MAILGSGAIPRPLRAAQLDRSSDHDGFLLTRLLGGPFLAGIKGILIDPFLRRGFLT